MSNYIKGNTWSTVYTQILGVGATGSHGGLDASLDDVWTDDGAGSKNLAPFQLSTSALQMTTTSKLQFHDSAIYIHASGDGVLNLVADGEIDLATAALDINATSTCEIDNTNTTNGVKLGTNTSGGKVFIGHTTSETTVNDNLTVTGTTALTGTVTVANGQQLRFADAGENISSDGTDLTLNSGADINLTATADINIPSSVGLTFGDDGEKIEGDGTNLVVTSSGALNFTGAAASTWKTTAGTILIDAEAAALDLNGHSGVNIIGNAGEVDITTTGALDLNCANYTLDASGTLSIDVAGGVSNITSTTDAGAEDFTIEVAGATDSSLILKSSGTGADALQLLSTAGGIDILSTGGTSDIDIYNTGGSVNITATEDHTAALTLTTTAGGIDILATGVAGDDLDLIAAGTSVNVTATEDHAESIYIKSDGSTAAGIKIHADTGNIDKSIYLLSDVGSVTIDAGNTSTDKGVLINTNTSGGKVYIGHTTSETTVQDNLTVTGDLSVTGSAAYGSLGVSHATAAVFTLDNQEHSNSDGARDITFKFTGEKSDGTSVDDMAQILVAHDGSGDDQKGFIDFKTNGGAEGTSPSSALKLSADNTATFSGAIAAGTQAITCGQLNADNLRLDGNVLSSQDSNGNITLTPNGSGAVVIDGCSILVDSDTVVDASVGTGTGNTIFGKNAGDAIESNASNNSLFGQDAGGAITTGDYNILIGNNAGDAITTQAYNVGIGSGALGAAAVGSLTAVGANALLANNSGTENTGIGFHAGLQTTSGDQNTFLGNIAGYSNTTASFNTAIGYKALYDSNRTADVNAHNTAVGCTSGENVSTGHSNTLIGSAAGDVISTGYENTVLGYNCDTFSNDEHNNVIIGNNLTGTEKNNAIFIGNDSSHIENDFNADATWNHSSDKRQKTNIKDDLVGLDFIKDIRPVTYVHKSPSEFPEEWDAYNPDDKEPMGGDKVIHGFIAQEVKDALDKAGLTTLQVWSEGHDGRQRVGTGAFVMPLINAVKELSAENDKLKQENKAFESRLAVIEAKLNDAGK